MNSILLIDDDPDTRQLLGEFLTQEGFEVHTAGDGREALLLLEKMPAPTLILLDYIMPEMNGTQFLAIKRRNPGLRPIPVVVLSAWTRGWIGTRLGVDAVLTKPVDLDKLAHVVSRICGMTHGHVEHRRAPRHHERVAI